MKDLTKVGNFNYGLEKIFPEAEYFLPIMGTDYVEYYVGNAKQAAHFYKTALGFQSLAYAGLETGMKDRTSYVVVQDKIRLVFTTPMPGTDNTKLDDRRFPVCAAGNLCYNVLECMNYSADKSYIPLIFHKYWAHSP